MNIKFSPVPVEDRERGRNGNCYNPLSALLNIQLMILLKYCLQPFASKDYSYNHRFLSM